MATRTHKSYKLKDDSLEQAAREFQKAASELYRKRKAVEEAQKAEVQAKEIADIKEAQLVQLLSRKHTSITIDRVKYSVKDGVLHREIIYG